MMRLLIVAVLLLAILGIALLQQFGRKTPDAVSASAPASAKAAPGATSGNAAAKIKRFPVEVSAVQAEPVERSVHATGSIAAFETIAVAARVAGVVERLAVAEGDSVTEGQLIAEIEPARYRLAVDRAGAALAQAEASLAEASAQSERRERLAGASSAALISKEELDLVRARVAAAMAGVATARAGLASAELDLRDARVLAPIAGVIQQRSLATGTYAMPGTPIATLLRRDPLLVRFPVSSGDAALLQPGATVHVAIAGRAQHLGARIAHVAGSADASTRQIAVVARMADAPADVRPGTFCRVRVDLPAGDPLLVVPDLAVLPSERGFVVFVVEAAPASAAATAPVAAFVRERQVVIAGRTADARIRITAGLTAGERIVVRGGEALRDGYAVDVIAAGTLRVPAARSPKP